MRRFATTLSIISFLLTPSLTWATSPVKIKVPYTMQAPDGNWAQPWQDTCEEASIYMVERFYRGTKLTTIPKAEARAAMLKYISFEDAQFGHNKDTNAAEIVDFINLYLPFESYQVTQPKIQQIKSELDNKRPVLALVDGKALRNPHFKNGGPAYHVLVLTGYDDTKAEFITNDPGFGSGLDFRYSYATLMNALHDFRPNGQTKNAPAVAVFTRHDISSSADSDGDNDGLSKADEIALGTNLMDTDSDHDGFSDGTEVENEYSPTLNESALLDGDLIKTADAPMIYQIFVGYKKPIANETVFVNNGWSWKSIKTVSQRYADSLIDGDEITE